MESQVIIPSYGAEIQAIHQKAKLAPVSPFVFGENRSGNQHINNGHKLISMEKQKQDCQKTARLKMYSNFEA